MGNSRFFSKGAVLIVLLSSLLCACSLDTDNLPTPNALTQYTPDVKFQKLWQASVDEDDSGNLPLPIAATVNTLFIASHSGTLQARNAQTGKILWTVHNRYGFTSGPGVGNAKVAIATEDANVYVYNAYTGKEVWHRGLSNQVLATPTIRYNKVYLNGVDGTVTVRQAANGELEWRHRHRVPNLVLRRASAVAVDGPVVAVGFADGKVSLLNAVSGQELWTQQIALPQGPTAISQMVDVDSTPIITRSRIYAASYQGNIAALALRTGNPIWSKPISSYNGLAMRGNLLLASSAKGQLIALEKGDGSVEWQQSKLQYRQLSAPAVGGDHVFIGDKEGVLHVLATEDGHLQGRIQLDESGILAPPLVRAQMVYVLTQNGTLQALRYLPVSMKKK